MSATPAHDSAALAFWQGRDVRALAADWGIPELSAHARLGSTNDEARRRAAAGCPAGLVVIADEQTAGRGRGGNTWSAAAGSSLLLSIVLRPAVGDGAACFGALPLRAGLAVARAVHEITGVRADFKWPNDLLVKGRKLAGILSEGALDPGGGFVVCGVGLNVSQSDADFPAPLRGAAVSLHAAGAPGADRVALAGAVVRGLMRAGSDLAPLSSGELSALRSIDALRGNAITVDGTPAGIADGIAPDGSLCVRNGAEVQAVYSGTVRPTSQPQPPAIA